MIIDDNRTLDRQHKNDQIFLLGCVIAIFVGIFILMQPWRSVENWLAKVVWGTLVYNSVCVFYHKLPLQPETARWVLG